MKQCIVWLRKDLRLEDHACFHAAVEKGFEIIPVFIWDDQEHRWSDGAASQWWLHHALEDLSCALKEQGGELQIYQSKGNVADTLRQLIKEHQADVIYWGRRYEPEIIERDKVIKQGLSSDGFEVKSFNTHLLLEPHTIENKSGGYYKVFTPYWKHCRDQEIPKVLKTDWKKAKWCTKKSSLSVADLKLLPTIPWDVGLSEFWEPTREGGMKRLKEMSANKFNKAAAYQARRDTPSEDGTSRIAPYLQWGQVSVREVYYAMLKSNNDGIKDGYMRQLFWREFSYHLLFHAPHSTDKPLRPEYELFPWKRNKAYLKAWQQGQTGYPIVDAGMRQLWQTGWMHNRVRMIVSSFLVKHLLQDWREGASWFWDTLVDADLANNTMGWQWIAGSGADAAPYFRIFNPITQGEKFDKNGDYVRKYCPELVDVPNKYLHQPWEMPELELASTGVVLGKDYPIPIISHADGRQSALAAFQKFKDVKEA